MNKFLDLFEKNVVISGALALVLVTPVAYLAVVGQPIPEGLLGLAGIVVGYFFGSGKHSAAIQTFKAN